MKANDATSSLLEQALHKQPLFGRSHLGGLIFTLLTYEASTKFEGDLGEGSWPVLCER